ncbi:MAG TPA: hypothetical protein VFC16_05205 [Nakamurella sp.]|nr:hypothetical protein [Nakamurella sp.]
MNSADAVGHDPIPSPTRQMPSRVEDPGRDGSGGLDPVDGRDVAVGVDAVAGVAAACPGVFGLSAAVRSYLPGRVVAGVLVADDHVQVNVIAEYGPPLTEIAHRLAAALTPVLAGKALWVTVDDIVMPADSTSSEHSGEGA